MGWSAQTGSILQYLSSIPEVHSFLARGNMESAYNFVILGYTTTDKSMAGRDTNCTYYFVLGVCERNYVKKAFEVSHEIILV